MPIFTFVAFLNPLPIKPKLFVVPTARLQHPPTTTSKYPDVVLQVPEPINPQLNTQLQLPPTTAPQSPAAQFKIPPPTKVLIAVALLHEPPPTNDAVPPAIF